MRDAMRGTDGPIYREVLAMDSRGHVTEEMRANEPAMTTQRTYEPSTGRLLTITSNNGALQQLEYDYDPLGNVILRKDDSDGAQIRETYAVCG